MHRSITVKKELSRKAKLSIYWFIYVLTLNYSHELWVMAKLLPRDRLRSSVPWEELGVKPLFLHIERSQLRWLGHLFRMAPACLPGEVFRAGSTRRRSQGRPRTHWRDFVFWSGLGTPWDPTRWAGGNIQGEGSLGLFCCPCDLDFFRKPPQKIYFFKVMERRKPQPAAAPQWDKAEERSRSKLAGLVAWTSAARTIVQLDAKLPKNLQSVYTTLMT